MNFFYPFKTCLIKILYLYMVDFIEIKRWLKHRNKFSLSTVYLFILLIHRMLIYIGEHASLHHTLFKKKMNKNKTQSHSRPNLHSHTHRPDSNASVVMLKHNYLKYADLTKWESSCQVCTLIEVQLKLNLKPEYWQRVKYKMLSFPFFIFYFFTQTLFQNLPPLSNITPPSPDSPLSKAPRSVI